MIAGAITFCPPFMVLGLFDISRIFKGVSYFKVPMVPPPDLLLPKSKLFLKEPSLEKSVLSKNEDWFTFMGDTFCYD